MSTHHTATEDVSQLPAADSGDSYDLESSRHLQKVVEEDPGVARIEALCESHRLFTGRQ